MKPARLMPLLAVLVFSVLAATALLGLGQAPPTGLKVADKIRLQAWSFPLQDVRLLDGPFRDAMLLDQKYLLELDPDRLQGREIRLLRRSADVAWFEFAAICAGPRATADYVEIARDFHTVLVSGVPVFDAGSTTRRGASSRSWKKSTTAT